MKGVIPSDRTDLRGERELSEITGCSLFFAVFLTYTYNRICKKCLVLFFTFECIIMILANSVTDGICITTVCHNHKPHGRNGVET